MRISTLFSGLASLSFFLINIAASAINTFEIGSLVEIVGLEKMPHLNGSFGIIIKPTINQTVKNRLAVLLLNGDKIKNFDYEAENNFLIADYFSSVSVKYSNLRLWKWIDNDISEVEDYFTLHRVIRFIWKLCNNNPALFLDFNIDEYRVKLVGGWIFNTFNYKSLLYVCENADDHEASSSKLRMYHCLERVWDGISSWLK